MATGARASGWAARCVAGIMLVLLSACGGGGGGGAGPDAGPGGTQARLGVVISEASGKATLIGEPATFTATAYGGRGPYSYRWTFVDGTETERAEGTISHVFTITGSQQVLVVVKDATGNTARATTTINVEDRSGLTLWVPPSLSVGQPLAPQINVDNSTVVALDWDLGDGRTAQGKAPALAYFNKGQYVLTLVATYSNGVKRTATATVNVDTDAPALSVSIPAGNIYPGNYVTIKVGPDLRTFESLHLFVNGKDAGYTSTGFSLPKAGTYEVRFERTNATGAIASASLAVTVLDPVPPSGLALQMPAATTSTLERWATQQFSVKVAVGDGNHGNKYQWDFGDGQTESSEYNTWINHTYRAAGVYTLTLTATNDYGLSATATGTVVVGPRQEITLLAGQGVVGTQVDGPALQARFMQPQALAFDASSNLFINDYANAALRKLSVDGNVSTVKMPSYCSAGYSRQMALAPYGDGNIDVYSSCGGLVRLYPGAPSIDQNSIAYPVGSEVSITQMARAPDGALVMAGSGVLRRLETDGRVTYLAGVLNTSGGLDGTGANATFDSIRGIGFDNSGQLYVADYLRIRKVTSTGEVTTLAGQQTWSTGFDGQGTSAAFGPIKDMSVASDGTMYVLQENGAIRQVTAAGAVTTLPVAADNSLSGIAVAPNGTLVVSRAGTDAVYKVQPNGSLTLLAGIPPTRARVDGRGNAAVFWETQGVAEGPSGALYVADSNNHALRKVLRDGTVTTLAVFSSNGVQVYGSTPFYQGVPMLGEVAVDAQENVYVADAFMNVIRKVAPDGTQSILAGQPGSSGYANGPAQQALFYSPLGVAVDAAGNVYVSDLTHTIRKISPAGVVSLVAGVPRTADLRNGAASQANFNFPTHLAAAADGTLYVADYGNNVVRKITPEGEVSTVAGRRGASCSIDGPLGTNCTPQPMGLSLDTVNGDLYIATSVGVMRLRPDGWVEELMQSNNYPYGRRTNLGPIYGYNTWIASPQSVAVLSDRQLAITTGDAVLVTSFKP
ncbi:PKD domain-containing protein [Roseateles terrae]|uniref:PKD repeat protein n=1 Tax=Roseateles terrae TaxID=431060 RepID=A0ABR6GQR1_9BURK|nr:PKD domain-containing protein [Roseateles terrae]MBB3194041.1 PKD repeat protein [Roseateles terrae]